MPSVQLEQRARLVRRLKGGNALIIAQLEVSESHVSSSQIPYSLLVSLLWIFVFFEGWFVFPMSFWRSLRRKTSGTWKCRA